MSIPGPVYLDNAGTCRRYTHTIYIDGRPAAGLRHSLPPAERWLGHRQLTPFAGGRALSVTPHSRDFDGRGYAAHIA